MLLQYFNPPSKTQLKLKWYATTVFTLKIWRIKTCHQQLVNMLGNMHENTIAILRLNDNHVTMSTQVCRGSPIFSQNSTSKERYHSSKWNMQDALECKKSGGWAEPQLDIHWLKRRGGHPPGRVITRSFASLGGGLRASASVAIACVLQSKGRSDLGPSWMLHEKPRSRSAAEGGSVFWIFCFLFLNFFCELLAELII